MTTALTRGIRNCNPCNVERTTDKWVGMAPIQTDSRFCVFTKPEYGIRAALICARHILGRTGGTLADLISAWAPTSENDTASYLSDVSRRSGFAAPSKLDLFNYGVFEAAFRAIIVHENGHCPYPQSTFATAYDMAGQK